MEEIKKKWQPGAEKVLLQAAELIENTNPFDADKAAISVKELIQTSGIKMNIIMPLLRAALTGSLQGPDVFTIAGILGSKKTSERIRKFAQTHQN